MVHTVWVVPGGPKANDLKLCSHNAGLETAWFGGRSIATALVGWLGNHP